MKIKNAVIASVVAFASVACFSAPVNAAVTCPAGSKNSSADTLAECNIIKDDSLIPTVNDIINAIIGILGLVAVLVIVLAGVSYTTSAGDPAKAKKAKDAILYGVIGLIIAILAFAIVNFALTSVLGGSAPAPSGP